MNHLHTLSSHHVRTMLLTTGFVLCPLLASAQAQVAPVSVAAPIPEPEVFPTLITEENIGKVSAGYENTPLPRALSEAELTLLASRVLDGNAVVAGNAARVLANASSNDTGQRLDAILTRFEREVEHPPLLPTFNISSLSGHAQILVQYLLAFSHLDKPQTIAALETERAGEVSPTLRKWLTIASGYAGDERVAAPLKSYLDAEKEGSTRALLLRAYALTAGKEAIPILESYLNDETVTANGCFGPCYGVQMTARDELARLRPKADA
jgi:hypothetical protein